MTFKDLFKKKKQTKPYAFDELGREVSLQRRKQAAELKKLEMENLKLESQLEYEDKKAQLEELKEQLNPTEDMGEDNMISKLLIGILAGNNPNPNIPNAQPQIPTEQKINFTEQEIRAFLASLGRKQLKIARQMEDETLKKVILAQIPNISDESLNEALLILRE